MDATAATALNGIDFGQVILAIGGLGTAAYGVVDATKAFGGGISNRGFGDIKKVIGVLISDSKSAGQPALGLTSALATLRANWLNGMALADQKSVAKALIKLNLTEETAPRMAEATGVTPDTLKSLASKLATPQQGLTQEETDVYGRFDLLLNTLLDQAYQRADQRYRNSAKLLAIPVAVALAIAGAWAIGGNTVGSAGLWKAVIAGLLATPLAPVAKDVASAIQAGAKVAQSWKRLR